MATVAELVAHIRTEGGDKVISDLRKVDGAVDATQTSMRKSLDRFGSSMQAVGKKMAVAGGVMTAAVTVPLVALGKQFGEEMTAIQEANNQTTAALRRMGAGSLVTVKGVQQLAGQLQQLSGIDDQVIQSGQNLLLTLGNMNTATKSGADNFENASRAIVDMAEAMGTDPVAAARQLGVALAKPEQAAGRLVRSGIVLTEQQKKQIEAFAKAGKTAKAQGVIIDAVGRQFQGAANLTDADKWAVLKDQFLGIGASLLGHLMPAVDRLRKALVSVMEKFEGLSPKAQKFIAVLVGLAAAIGPLLVIGGTLVTALGAISTALAGVSLPVVAVIAGIAALVAGLVIAYKRSETFREVINGAFKRVREVVLQVLRDVRKTLSTWGSWARSFWKSHGTGVMKEVKRAWTAVKSVVGPAIKAVKNIIITVLRVLRGDWKGAWSSMKDVVKNIIGSIKGLLGNLLPWAGGMMLKLGAKLATTLSKGLAKLPRMLWEAGKAAGNKLAEAIKQAINGALDKVRNFRIPSMKIPKLGTIGGQQPFAGIPRLAAGGLAFSPSLAVVGDNRNARHDPEVIAPLSKLAKMLDGGGRTTNMGGVTINIHGERDPWLTGRKMRERLQQELARAGA